MNRAAHALSGIYLILDHVSFADPLASLSQAAQAGVRIFQYRCKGDVDRKLVRRLRAAAHAFDGILIINDHPELLDDADGLHLGQDDLTKISLESLRRQHPEKILGVSAHLPAQLHQSALIDYYGVGPYQATMTKYVERAPLGIDGIHEMVSVARRPVCAIGGIRCDDLAALRSAGAAMAAVIGVVATAADKRVECDRLVRAWNHAAP